ncbi:MAG TPA: histidine kinase [Pyrinomonadaceae bacterium]|nr:histidine kinase [Pyrinomonadaceae bacterium]
MENSFENFEQPSRALLLWKRPLVRIAAIWIAWTLIGLFFTSQVLFNSIYMEKRMPTNYVFFMQMSICYLWALTTPLVLWLARRFRIDRDKWLRRTLFHVGVGSLLVGSMSAIHYVLFITYFNKPEYLTVLRDLQYVLYNLDRQASIYWVLVLLSHALNYYQSYRKGELRASRLETQLAQSQLEALKMQVHPHFLFNTLHSISALLNRDTEAARRMITRLGDFLRMTLENAGAQEVTLQEEMEFLNKYLEIERIRFRDRLTTQVEVDPSVLDVRVPNLILQPIVENAMRHAIASQHAGRIEINAFPRNGCLRIQVKDNGPGLSDDAVSNQFGKGVGLANTKARLERLYGSEHLLELTNASTGGLIVTLEVPRKS